VCVCAGSRPGRRGRDATGVVRNFLADTAAGSRADSELHADVSADDIDVHGQQRRRLVGWLVY